MPSATWTAASAQPSMTATLGVLGGERARDPLRRCPGPRRSRSPADRPAGSMTRVAGPTGRVRQGGRVASLGRNRGDGVRHCRSPRGCALRRIPACGASNPRTREVSVRIVARRMSYPPPATVGRMTTQQEVALLRLAAQWLAGPRAASPADAVRRLAALQGQDFPGARHLGRPADGGPARKDVEAALDDGEIVRSWPMRGTLHLLAADDLRWMLELLGTPGAGRRWPRRRAQLDLDRGRRRAARASSSSRRSPGGRRMRRADLLAAIDDGGVATTGQRGYHLLWLPGADRHALPRARPTAPASSCSCCSTSGCRAPRRLGRDEALGELAAALLPRPRPGDGARPGAVGRHARCATPGPGWPSPGPELAALEVDGVEHLLDPATPDRLAGLPREAAGLFLLPGFDEFVLGYARPERRSSHPRVRRAHRARAATACSGRPSSATAGSSAPGSGPAAGRSGGDRDAVHLVPRRRSTRDPRLRCPAPVVGTGRRAGRLRRRAARTSCPRRRRTPPAPASAASACRAGRGCPTRPAGCRRPPRSGGSAANQTPPMSTPRTPQWVYRSNGYATPTSECRRHADCPAASVRAVRTGPGRSRRAGVAGPRPASARPPTRRTAAADAAPAGRRSRTTSHSDPVTTAAAAAATRPAPRHRRRPTGGALRRRAGRSVASGAVDQLGVGPQRVAQPLVPGHRTRRSPSCFCRDARPREALDFTVPRAMPRAAAISASLSSDQ